jgi:four helix bundle protein
MSRADSQAAINHKCREMIKLLHVQINHFPRHEKYGLSQQIRNAAYDVYAMIVEGQKRYHNKTTLQRLDVRHEQLRAFVNLAFDLDYYSYEHQSRGRSPGEALRRYTAVSLLVNELGAMIGGWIRHLREQDSDKGQAIK